MMPRARRLLPWAAADEPSRPWPWADGTRPAVVGALLVTAVSVAAATLLLLHRRRAEAAPAQPRRRRAPPLASSLVSGDVDLVPGTIDQLGESPLCAQLPIILLGAGSLPFMLGSHRRALYAALERRAQSSVAVAQALAHARCAGYSNEVVADRPGADHALVFFRRAAANGALSPGAELVPEDGLEVFHPLAPTRRLARARVAKIFKSNARPALLVPDAGPPMILKSGDDLRQDAGVLAACEAFNALWRRAKLRVSHDGPPVACRTYRVAALAPDLGVVECVDGAQSIKHWFGDEGRRQLFAADSDLVERFMASAAAGYVAAFVLGIRDRHSDNVMVDGDGYAFHIDFGHVLGDSVTLDTAPFAIIPGVKKALGDRWPEFVDLCVKAFAVLRRYEDTVANIAGVLLPPHGAAFVRQACMMEQDMGTASERVRRLVEAGPGSFKTRIKNGIHSIAVR